MRIEKAEKVPSAPLELSSPVVHHILHYSADLS
jgi:hypothetical protein